MLDVCFQTTPGLKEKVGVQMGQDWLSQQVLRLVMGIWALMTSSYFCLNLSIWKVKKQSTRPPKNLCGPTEFCTVHRWKDSWVPVNKAEIWNAIPHFPFHQRRTWHIFLINNGGFSIYSTLSWEGLVSVFAPTWCPSTPPCLQVSEEQCFNNFLKALREKVEIKQLKHFWDIVVQGKVSFVICSKHLCCFF